MIRAWNEIKAAAEFWAFPLVVGAVVYAVITLIEEGCRP